MSALSRDIDERVGAFLERLLVGDWPHLWLDATYLQQREGERIVSVAVIVAVAANTDGKREIVGPYMPSWQARRTVRYKSTVMMPPPSPKSERAKLAKS